MDEKKPGKVSKKEKKIARTLKRKSVRDYILQLSIVVIGILLTFQGSAWIERVAQRKEARRMLAMVGEELESNATTLQNMEDYCSYEKKGMEFFSDHMDSLQNAPQDSLAYYAPVLGINTTFKFSSNAFEVFRSSTSMQVLKDKELQKNLFMIYETLETLASTTSEYYLQKRRILMDFMNNLDREVTRELDKGNADPYLDAYIENNSTRNFIRNASFNISFPIEYCMNTKPLLSDILGDVRRESGIKTDK